MSSETVTMTEMEENTVKKVVHPFTRRLPEDSNLFEISPKLLLSAGFASLTVGLFTLFRPTPALLFKIITTETSVQFKVQKMIVYSVLFGWSGLLAIVFFLFGIVLVLSKRVKNRHALMLHPWGLLLLYLDMFVWVSLLVMLHFKLEKDPHLKAVFISKIQSVVTVFTIMYIECILCGFFYFIYASYFITAEITIIEKFY